jgi:ABC-2 type transport system ATP-binding protein
MKPIIELKQLSKHFKIFKHHRGTLGAIRNLFTREHQIVKAVDEISFRVNPGEMVGYIGPNGAGKSTTIKMLTGLLVPTCGSVQVNGKIPWQERQTYVARIGAVFGQRTTLWWDLPVIESLSLLRFIYKVPESIFNKNLSEFRELLSLDPFLDTPVRSLSLGQRMRADICAALLHNPDLLFLDEPTIGLDVVAKERIRHFIQHINRDRNTTILLTTHDLQDVEKLCDRVMIIDDGKMLFDGHLDTLKIKFGDDRKLLVEFAEPYPTYTIDDAEIIHQENQRVIYRFKRGTITASELIGRLSQQFRIHDLSVREPEIETTIRRIYEKQLLKEKP